MEMDVREATKKVKEYFKEVKDIESLGFDVENAQYDEKDKRWLVECSFYRNAIETKRVRFLVTVEDTGKILNLKQQNGSTINS